MIEIIINFTNEIIYFFNEVAIYLVFGFLIAGMLHVLFPEKFILKHIGKNNFSSVLKATLAGIPLPLCSCAVIPVAASLRKKGASKGAALSFLISTPQVGVDSFLVTYSLIGWVFAVMRIIAAFITALFSGIISNFFSKNEIENSKTEEVIEDKSSRKERLKNIFSYIQFELLGSFANYLMAGIFIAGLITVFIPASFFELYMSNQFVSMLVMLVIGIPIYVCATSSTPIAASLIMKGLSPGAALVFLLAGPATNAVTISTVIKTMGKKAAVIYLTSISVVSVVLGYLLNILTFETNLNIMHLHEHEVLPQWLKIGGSILLTIMLIGHYIQKIFFNKNKNFTMADLKNLKTLKVEGMTCNHCAENVRKAVASVEGVENVQINLGEKTVTFEFPQNNLEKIKNSIEEKGYEVLN